MKKLLLNTAVLTALGSSAFAQLPVSTTPQNRKVVLEEFTGIHCVYCPDGHKRANMLQASKPAGDVVLVNIHTGGYATPGAGEPDFRTAEGAAIASISGMNISGYPTGSVNRHFFNTVPAQTGFATNRGDWARFADSILAMPSYVNVALQGTLDAQTRQLTVDVQVYYTGTPSASVANNLTVMLLEDNVLGPQIGSGDFYPQMIQVDGNYTHNHMLRKVLTPSATGETLTGTATGTTITKTYTYTVPAQFVNNPSYLGNLQLAAFVAEGNSEIMTAAYGPITITNVANPLEGQFTGNVISETEVCQGVLNPIVKVFNNGSTPIQSGTITADVNGGTPATLNFTQTIAPQTFGYVALPVTTFTPVANNTLNLQLTQVNGTTNPATTGATISKSNILLTTRLVTQDTVTMTFVQDRYGSESTWKVINEATGSIVAQGGPYTDLSANTTQTHIAKFKVVPSTCYKVLVEDSYGDGINTNYGAGSYTLTTNSGQVYASNGKFGKGEDKYFKTDATLLAVANVAAGISKVSVYPNPTNGLAAASVQLDAASKVSIEVFDITGRVIATVAEQKLAAGEHIIDLPVSNLASGLYNVKISTAKGSVTERLSIVK